MNCKIPLFIIFWFCSNISKCDLQAGPDPWHYEAIKLTNQIEDPRLPPDLKTQLRNEKPKETKFGFGEWWFKRLLALLLKSGQVKKSEDGNIYVSLQMKFSEDQWGELDDCLKSESSLSDVTFRRSISYIEEAIYKPTVIDKISMAWSDYIQIYLIEYKVYITCLFGALGAIGILIWLWKHVSHKHIILIMFLLLYIYEVIISYMEAEQKEYEKFLSAINTCKWYFWTTECTVPTPDPILFLKHMNPMKIAIRMFTSLISEPVLAINSVIKIILEDVTGGLWYPFDKIVYGILIVVINISLIYLLIMIVFNFIFNISFNFNFLSIIGINVKQKKKSIFRDIKSEEPAQVSDTDRISGARLDRLLDVCSLALTNVQNRSNNNETYIGNSNQPKLQRSASTGRLLSLKSLENKNDKPIIFGNLRKRVRHIGGDGDY